MNALKCRFETLRYPILVAACLSQTFSIIAAPAENLLVYFGTSTRSNSQGIYCSRFSAASGQLSSPELVAETKNPTFLSLHPNKRLLYAVSEVSDNKGQRSGAVSAFVRDLQTGKLTLLNQQPSAGGGPTHLSVDPTGHALLVANYGSGSIALLPILPDGRLSPPSATIQDTGSSVNPQRQAGPHAHFIIPDPSNRFVLACDLGLDKVLVYHFNPDLGTLTPNEPPFATLKPGSGPRHLAFAPGGRRLYVISEMACTLTGFDYDSASGVMKAFQTVSTLSPDFNGSNTCAEVQVALSGRFVYASNRGENTIAVFSADPTTGRLSLLQSESTQGRTPRHFALSPRGDWLFVENQDSSNVVVFRVDDKSGRISPTGQTIHVGSPACSVFVDVGS
jgi:6-phosphogluconolactonase